MRFSKQFDQLAERTARLAGHASTFAIAFGIVLAWAISGPIFSWSDTWQMVINTGTTIITFLMVFLIQNSQNRDTQAMQLKLDELIRASEPARNRLLRLEELTEKEREQIKATFADMAQADAPLAEERAE